MPRSAAAVLASFVTIALLCTTLCTTRSAHANGRFPQAQAIESVPGSDGSTLYLRATFGILISRDSGKTWRWLCERALGFESSWDAPIAVTRDGRLWVGLEHGLVSTLDGCTIDTTPALGDESVKDLTVDAKGETVWALTARPDRPGAIWRGDQKSGFERMGVLPENINPMTIEVAPSKASRVYVTGQPYGTLRGWLWKSDDGGKTFAGAKNDLAHTGPLFIAAVDPKDPNRVLMRHLHTTGSTVLVTPDAGKTFKEVLSMDSAMFGFAKSADGLTYFAASGLAKDGIFQSVDRGEHFTPVSNHGVLCLHSAPGGKLFVCENPFTVGAPGIGLSTDQGKTVNAITLFGDILGAVECGDSEASKRDAGGALCAAGWPDMRAQIVPIVDAGTRDAGLQITPARRSNCGCRVVGAHEEGPDHGWLTTGLLPLVVWARARRRCGSRGAQSGP